MPYHPDDSSAPRSKGAFHLRWEDLAQDGRMMLEPLTACLGVLWRDIEPTARRWVDGGVLPIFSRIVLEAGDGPFAVDGPVSVEGRFRLTHDADAQGTVSRVFLDGEAELTGELGRTTLPPPEDAGRKVRLGLLQAEHVFTRPFAEAAERKVTSLTDGGKTYVPKLTRAWKEPAGLLVAPEKATAIDAEFAEDGVPVVLGVRHTDSNQHVNSMIYPRIFEEAVLRRLAMLGRSTDVLARRLEVAFRKPSFAGETLKVSLRLFEQAGAIVACGAFLGPESTDLKKARVFLQLLLR